jgi:hypothetical protein
MTHQSDTTALRSRAEEGNLGLVAPELLGVGQHGLPGGVVAGILVVLDRRQMGAESGICLDDAPPADLEEGNERRTKVPVRRPCQLPPFSALPVTRRIAGWLPIAMYTPPLAQAHVLIFLTHLGKQTGEGKKCEGVKRKKRIEMKRRKKIS